MTQNEDPNVVRLSDGSISKNEIVANRRIVITTLDKVMSFDVSLTCLDLHLESQVLAIAAGKMPSFFILAKLGRSAGSIHRDTILNCRFDTKGTMVATCGLDKRVVIWGIDSQRTKRVFEGHKGEVYKVQFNLAGDIVYSCSSDGKVLVWEWETGTTLYSFMRHPSGCSGFSVNHDFGDNLFFCGRMDGVVSTWDFYTKTVIDTIIPDPEWTEGMNDKIGWNDLKKHHSGGITAIQVSPNNRYLATGSADNTCKLWSITSYAKDVVVVKQEITDALNANEMMNQCINILDEKYNAQLNNQDYLALKAGEVPIQTGFHADLMFTYRHEAKILDIKFNSESNIVITGSQDCTCRLWSGRRGDLLFQINTPAPVSSLFITPENKLFAICDNRLLVFGIQAHKQENELPAYWKTSEIDEAFADFDTKGQKTTTNTNATSGIIPQIPADGTKKFGEKYDPQKRMVSSSNFHREESGKIGHLLGSSLSKSQIGSLGVDNQLELSPSSVLKRLPSGVSTAKSQLKRREIKKMIGHGLALNSFLNVILEEYPDVNKDQLYANMKKYGLDAKDVLKLIASQPFKIEDLLNTLATKNSAISDVIYNLIALGGSEFMNYMLSHGCKISADEEEREEIEITDRSGTGVKSFRSDGTREGKSKAFICSNIPSSRGVQTQGRRQGTGYTGYNGIQNDLDGIDGDGQFSEMQKYDEMGRPRGSVLHFIPAEQMKIVKDYQSNREVKSVFMTRLFMKNTPPIQYPNFGPDSTVPDSPRKGVNVLDNGNVAERFNEPLTKKNGPKKRSDPKERLIRNFKENQKNNQNKKEFIRIGPKNTTVGGSSKFDFRPERYLQARGLNVSFGPHKMDTEQQSSSLFTGRAFAQPMGFRQFGNIADSVLVGKKFAVDSRDITTDQSGLPK